MRIRSVLFLDDNEDRIERASEHFLSGPDSFVIFIARTAEEAIKELKECPQPFDLVMLDHDLGGEVFQPSDETSGHEVAKFISTMEKKRLPKEVIIHSFNPVGSANMMALLIDVVPVSRIPFNL